MANHCTQCGTPQGEDRRVCATCGAELRAGPRRRWLWIAVTTVAAAAAVVGIAVVASEGDGEPAADATAAPATEVTTASTATVTAAGPAAASVVARIPGNATVLSPDGSRLLLTDGDGKACVATVATAAIDFCVEDPFEMAFDTLGSWSPDSSEIVFANQLMNPDIAILDVATGAIRLLTDDGVVDLAPEGLGQGLIDRYPVWTPDGSIVFFRAAPGEHLAVTEVDRSGAVVASIELPTRESESERFPRPQDRVHSLGVPMVRPNGSILVGGDAAIFEIDAELRSVTEIADYSAQYAPEEQDFGVAGLADVLPLGELPDGRIVLQDDLSIALVSQGAWHIGPNGVGPPSTAYIFDPGTGVLTPIFERATGEAGWLGPTRVAISPSGTHLAVMWLAEDRLAADFNVPRGLVSLVDLATVEFPVDPRSLPLAWGEDGQDPIEPVPELGIAPWVWAANGTIAVTTLPEQQTLILQLSD